MLADPGLVIGELVQPLDQRDVPLDRQVGLTVFGCIGAKNAPNFIRPGE